MIWVIQYQTSDSCWENMRDNFGMPLMFTTRKQALLRLHSMPTGVYRVTLVRD